MIAPHDVTQAAQVLKQGGVIAYPTEAVWGLGCDPYNEAAVQRLLSIKQRAFEKGVLMVCADIAMAQPWLAPLPVATAAQIRATWPGPSTWVMPDAVGLPSVVKGGRDTVAIRVSAHAGVQALSRAFGGLIVSTSANPSGAQPYRTMAAVVQQFQAQLDFIVPGQLGGAAQPSSIFDALTGEQLR